MGSSSISLTLVGVGLLTAFPVLAQPGAAFPPPGAAPAPADPPPAPAPAAPPAPVAPPAPPPAATVPPAAAAPAPAPTPAPAPSQQAAPVVLVPAEREASPPTEVFFTGAAPKIYPEEAAVDSSPFIDATVSLVSMEDRFTDPFVFGIAFGGYLGRTVRLVARLEMPSTDNGSNSYEYDNGAYSIDDAKSVTLIYGGAIGVIAAYSQAFVFSPGLTFLRTDVGEYGNMVGIAIPFEWTTNRGLRFGFEVNFGRSFGGTRTYRDPSVCSNTSCVPGAEHTKDRDAARALALRFEIGFGFNHPKPRAAPF